MARAGNIREGSTEAKRGVTGFVWLPYLRDSITFESFTPFSLPFILHSFLYIISFLWAFPHLCRPLTPTICQLITGLHFVIIYCMQRRES